MGRVWDWGVPKMPESRVTRRLAAIVAADLVGYSRHMAADEAGTIMAVKGIWQDIVDPRIARHHGRVVRMAGDGALAEFGSVIDAVECAIDIQRAMAERNTQAAEDSGEIKTIEMRIGVNLGDIIIEDDDIFGDGVNIAARLEAEAPSGGILTSDIVYAQVSGKVGITFVDAGEVSLKNITRPLRVWRWDGCNPTDSAPLRPSGRRHQERPSIAVLPFTNMTADIEQDYFSDGITEDIITELTRFRSLRVIARNSTFTFKGTPVDIAEVGRKLGARYVVEGSVRKAGKRVRVTVQLIEADGGTHLWADRYDRELEDIFAVQDEVTRTIVSRVAGRVELDALQRAKRKPTQNMVAYDYLLQGIQHFNRYRREENAEAQRLFAIACELDPEFALAYAYLATTFLHDWFWDATTEAIDPRAYDYAHRAIILDDQESRCHLVLGRVQLHRKNFEPAIYHHRRCVEQNPNDADIMANMGMLLTFIGQPEEGIVWIESAMELNPYHPDWYCEDLGEAFATAGRYEDAIAAFSRIADPPLWVRCWIAACLGHLGNRASIAAIAADLRREAPDLDWEAFARKEPFRYEDDVGRLVEGLVKAGLVRVH